MKKILILFSLLFSLTAFSQPPVPFSSLTNYQGNLDSVRVVGLLKSGNAWSNRTFFGIDFVKSRILYTDSGLIYITPTFLTNWGLSYYTKTQSDARYDLIITAPFAVNKYLTGYKTFGTLNSDSVIEAGNQYFTQGRVRSTPITGFASGSGVLAGTDNILQAIQKLDGNIGVNTSAISGKEPTITAPFTIKKYLNGYKQFVSLNSDSLAEGSTNLFYTNGRVQTFGDTRYDLIITPPYTTLKYFNGYKQFVALNTDSIGIEGTTNKWFTNARAQSAISLTTTGTSGAATYTSGVLNIPNYGAASGMANPMTTINDIIVAGTGGSPLRLALGASGTYLKNVSGAIGYGAIQSADVPIQMSITSDASGLKLSGDATTPGNYMLYGTDNSGTRGWFPRIATANSIGITTTSTTSVIALSNDASAPGNNMIYGTNSSGTKGWVTQGIPYASVVTGLTAAGTNQGTALSLSGNNSFQEITTTASGTGVKLPTSSATSSIIVVNRGANTLTVYPSSSGIINGQSSNLGYLVPSGSVATFLGKDGTSWYTENAFTGGDVSTTDASGVITVSGIKGASVPTLSNGLLKNTGGVWSFDASTYLTSAVTSITPGWGLTPQTAITSTGSPLVDSFSVTSKASRDKLKDSLQANINTKQATLVSGTNIKTINGNSLLGSGDLSIAGGVATVFGRSGAVVAQSGDYTFSQIGSTPTTLGGYGITDAYTKTQSDGNYYPIAGGLLATGGNIGLPKLSTSPLSGADRIFEFMDSAGYRTIRYSSNVNGGFIREFIPNITANRQLTWPDKNGTVATTTDNISQFTNNAGYLSGTVGIGNGGTGQITQQAAIDALTGTQTNAKYLRSDGTHSTLSTIVAGDVPTLNQNTTGSAGSISGTNVITNTNLAQMPANTIKLNNTGSPATPIDATVAQTKTLLNYVEGDIPSLTTDLAGKSSLPTSATGLTAAGTTQGTALALSGNNSLQEITTAASGTGVILPVATATSSIVVVNRGANPVNVYPATSGIINGQAANTAYILQSGTSVKFYGKDATSWYTVNARRGGDANDADGTNALTLASVITAGSCTSCNLTYDAKGRITVAGNGSGGGGSSFPTQQRDATTGTSVTVTNQTGNIWLIKDPASTVATYTITFPATPVDGQELRMSFGGTVTTGNVVTAISLSGNGKTILQNTTPSNVQAGETLIYQYEIATTTWRRIK